MTALPRPVLVTRFVPWGPTKKAEILRYQKNTVTSCRSEFMGHAKEFKNCIEPMFLILFTRLINAK